MKRQLLVRGRFGMGIKITCDKGISSCRIVKLEIPVITCDICKKENPKYINAECKIELKGKENKEFTVTSGNFCEECIDMLYKELLVVVS